MIIKKISTIKRSYGHWRGWRTNRKLLIIESDDWGSIRTSSSESLNFLERKGYPVKNNAYNLYDALESDEDVAGLIDLLGSIRNQEGKSPVFTANQLMANPDFEKIKSDRFNTYHYEPSSNTYLKYSNSSNVLDYFKSGMELGVWNPQLHGREHVHIKRWLNALQNGEKASLDAFDCGMFSLHSEVHPANKNEFMEAFDVYSDEDHLDLEQVISDAQVMFNQLWGRPSHSFIACCYIWHPRLEQILVSNNVRYMQGLSFQFVPNSNNSFKYKRSFHYTGQRSSSGLIYITRNAFFEPASYPNFNWIDDCLARIQLAFKWGAPAVLSTHRVNFIGRLDLNNRSRTLKQFQQLLLSIVKKWPDVEFVSSDKLGALLENNI